MNIVRSAFDRVDLDIIAEGNVCCFTFTGKEKDAESGYHYFGTRYYDADLLMGWLTVDPMADKYPSMSPYNYCAGNTVKLVDPDGEEISTHIDEEGNVLAVYNDGNFGIYMHSQQEIASWKNGGDFSTDPDNMVGVTLFTFSFQKGDKIDVGSYEAHNWMRQFEGTFSHSFPNPIVALVTYASEAGNGGRYDPKSYINNGSQLTDGTYVSPRDLGNFAAGYFGRALGLSKERLLASYGAFQLAKNNTSEFLRHYRSYYRQALNTVGDGVIPGHVTYGEDGVSNYFQRLGYENIRTIDDFNKRYYYIWK